MSFHLFIVSMVILTTLHTDMGTAVRIIIDPQNFLEGTGKTPVTISCTLDSREDAATALSSIRIVQNGWRAMAIAQPNIVSSYDYFPEDDANDVKAIGKIEENLKNIKDSYLNLTLKHPDKEDAGTFACHVIYYENDSKDAKINKDIGYLAMQDPEVRAMFDKFEDLKKQVEKRENEIRIFGEERKKDESKLFGLDKKVKNRDSKIIKLTKDEKKVEDKVTQLKEKSASKLKTFENLNFKNRKEAQNAKAVLLDATDRIKRDRNELNEIAEKEAEDHRDVNDLVVNSGRTIAELKDLKKKENNMEEKIMELMMNVRNSIKKMDEITRSKQANKAKEGQLAPKWDILGGYLKDVKKKEEGIEKKLAELEKKVEENISTLHRLDLLTEDGEVKVDESDSSDLSREYFDPMTAFAAANQNSQIQIEKRKNLVFSDVVFKSGVDAYNQKTGVFKAPSDGVYHFSLMIKVECTSCFLLADVMVNKKRIAMRLKVGVLFDDLQGSASSVVQLNRGDEVKAVVNSTTDGLSLSANRMCLFSGHLVNPL